MTDDARVGPFRLLEVLGKGGQGTVYLAEQTEPMSRRVALKLLNDPVPDREGRARFEAERQALALMNHSNIAKVLDTGVTGDGRLWIAMELVEGLPITAYCERGKLGLPERLRLFAEVCRGVQYAHQKAVVHRDLKPSNVLVAEESGRPVPKIVDFGIAKSLERPLVDDALHTEPGRLLGTFEYMSPEQADSTGRGVDTRTDVYSLGAILYELLTGEPPFTRAHFAQAGVLEMCRVLCEVDPPRPSTRAKTTRTGLHAAQPAQHDLQRDLRRSLRGDLDWVAMKALEKDPRRRYQTAAELAGEVERFLRGDPIEARPPSLGYRLRKLARRHRGHVAWLAGLAVTLLASGVLVVWLWQRAEGALDRFTLMEYGSRLEALEAERRASLPLTARSAVALETWVSAAERLMAAVPAIDAGRDALDLQLERDRALDAYLAGVLERLAVFGSDDLEAMQAALRAVRAARGSSQQRLAPQATDRSLACMRIRLERIRRRGAADPRWVEAWAEAERRGLDLPRIEELTPLLRGAGPLGPGQHWELLHGASGPHGEPLPAYDEAGALRTAEDTGIVFVYVPVSEGGPFLLAKYEMTQSQWYWLSEGERPSGSWLRGDDSYPVESFTTEAVLALLDAVGLELPSVAAWQTAARAGTTGSPWGGLEESDLRRAINCLDKSYEEVSGFDERAAGWNDGWPRAAPPSAFPPNAWGFHHLLGNVSERCRSPGGDVVRCGGAYNSRPPDCTVDAHEPDIPRGDHYKGVRPAFPIRGVR